MKRMLKFILVLVFANTAWAQTEPNDCATALTVCGSGAFTSNAIGIGNTQEINFCGGFENNSLWLKINIVQAGTLGFDLIPDDPDISVDYDFWVFGPNVDCNAMGSPIRCATTNPSEAGLPNNITGMNGSMLITQTGPGPNGNGFVRWLNVLPGQSYYIAIDRPVGNGGFQIQWTGTATAGAGAFPIPPTATAIPDVMTCSNTANVGIYNLGTLAAQINPDTASNTISFHTTIADAVDNVNALPNIYSNTSNPQTIYVRVTDNVSGCYSTTDFDLVVNQVPTAAISVSDTAICSGNSVTVNFTGTPNTTFDYTVNGAAAQTATFDAAGNHSITQSPTADTVYTLIGVRLLDGSGTTICSQVLSQSVLVTVTALPTATISGTTTICSGTAAITFNGTPNATVTYNVDGAPNETIALDATGTASLTTPILTANSTYTLVSVTTAGTLGCSQSQTGSATVTVTALPTATISGTASICSGNTAVITFNGTPNATVMYNVDGGADQPIVLSATGTATLTTPVLTVNSTYNLVSATLGSALACSQPQTGSAMITVVASPTATISGSTTICAGNTAQITFSGTPNATVTYTVDGGSNQTVVLDAAGTAVVTTLILTANSTYTLVSVGVAGACSQNLSGSATVTVNALPTATISGTTSVCPGGSATVTFSGTPDTTVTYNIDGAPNQIIVLGATGTASLTTPVLTASSTYNLVSAVSGTTTCSQNLTGSATITVNPIPTATISGTTTICSGNTSVITFNGTPNATVNYTINGAPASVNLNAAGNAALTTSALTAATAYTITDVVLNGCTGLPASPASATVSVNPTPIATISGTASVCMNGASPTVVLTGANGTAPYTFTYSINGVTQPTVTTASGNSIILPVSTATPGTFTYALISVQGSGAGTCSQAQSGTAVVTVNPLPNATITASSPSVCLNLPGPAVTLTGANGTAPYTFMYTQNGNALTATSVGNTYTFNVPTGAVGPVAYELVSVTDANGCAQNINPAVTVTVLTAPTINTPPAYALCDDGANCFDLTGVVVPQVTSDTTLQVTFHESAADAQSGASPQASPYCVASGNTVLHIRVFDPNAPSCYATTTVQLTVNQNPEVALEDGHICVDATTGILTGNPYQLQTGLSTANHTFEWFDGSGPIPLATNSFYNATVAGQYFVEVTNTATGCSTVSNTVTVTPSSAPQQVSYTTSGYFADNAHVTITAEPAGNYEYQLDNGPFQPGNVFENIGAGAHTIRVRDVFGCDVLEDSFTIIGYPKYFTPNGDGYHDYWNISLPEGSAQIQIFDRYGKLLKSISTSGPGWDGQYNGHALPSTDYWFAIEYVEQTKAKQFKAHFALKR